MIRLMLSDCLWDLLRCSIKKTPAYETENLRMTMEGILWRFRTGAPWRDLPDEFGPWKNVFNRFNSWSKSVVWQTKLCGHGIYRVHAGVAETMMKLLGRVCINDRQAGLQIFPPLLYQQLH